MFAKNEKILFYQFENLNFPNITHGISTRIGGKSKNCYHSFNLALHVGDVHEDVLENRKLFSSSLGLELKNFVMMKQVHGNAVTRVDKSQAGKGLYSMEDVIDSVDGIYTSEKNLPLLSFSADCPLLLFCIPEIPAIGVAHSSWKGTVGGIAKNMVHALKKDFSVSSQKIWVGLAPCIRVCCYEVKDDVYNAAMQGNVSKESFIQKDGKLYFDLPHAIFQQLIEVEIPKQQIEIANICTSCSIDQFYSYRKENGHTGRFALATQIHG